MLFSEFKEKEVISLKECKQLGHVYDIEFDECGQIRKIMVPGKMGLCNLFHPEPEYVIPYNKICQIGPDIIIVEN